MKKVLKTVFVIAFSALLLVALTGCANVNYEVKLEKDGSGDISYIMGYDKSFLSSMQVSVENLKEDDSFNEMKQEATNEGYTIEDYEDDNTYGFKAYKHVDNVQNEFKINEDSEESDKINYEKAFLKTTYSQDAKVDLSDVVASGQGDALTTALLGRMKISYKVVLPFKVGDNNATTVSEDGKTLEWTLTAGQVNEIKFTAQEDNMVIFTTIIGIVLLVVILGAIIVVYTKKGKKADTKKQENGKSVKQTKTVEAKKEEVKEVKKEAPKKDEKKEEVKEAKKEAPKKDEKKEEVKEVKKEAPKKDEKKEEVKEAKKEAPKKDEKKEEVKEAKKEAPKKDEKKEEVKEAKKETTKKNENTTEEK